MPEEDAMAIKLIAFDMDDTLLLDDRTIGERTMRALRAAHEQGVRIVPATGRGKHSMWNYVEQIGVADAAAPSRIAVELPGTMWEDAGEGRSAQHLAITLLDALCSALS